MIHQKKKILLMDDEESIRMVVSSILQERGYAVTCTMNGEEAVENYRRELDTGSPFDAVILDLIIPGGLGGKETIVRLREIDPHVRAIVSSGCIDDPVLAAYREYGFRGVLPKPYRIQRLFYEIMEVISAPGPVPGERDTHYPTHDKKAQDATG